MAGVDDILRSLGRIEGTLDAVLREQQEQRAYIVSVSRRTAKLEQYRAKFVGAAAAVGAVVSAVVSFLLRSSS